MTYRIIVDWSPAYELIVSARAYVRETPKTLELPADWWEAARQKVGPDLVAEDDFHHTGWLYLFAWLCPDKQDAADFLRWLGGLTVGTFYELLAPFIGKGCPVLPTNLGASRDAAVRFLTRWYESYFRHVDPAILRGLEAEAERRRAQAEITSPEDLFEQATNGIQLADTAETQTALLIPQYHYSPLELQQHWQGLRLCCYGADVLPPTSGSPPPTLLRLTRALDDKNRLRVLRFLAREPHRFSEVVQEIGLTKGTVHHHLSILRAAGLLLVEDTGAETVYCLRSSALNALERWLHEFFSS
jgi:DNA-binding transcriptional ArsR family regulator